ncbi:MAG: winged helix-turn-helix transcriptional regulator [Phycisphaerales bacterium]|nr:winged helix-turn-helix transcriptional regulator [Phycisphaerales bacterium]
MLGFDRTFKAISDPTRRAILRVLNSGARNAGQIKDEIGIAANALSFHLRILKDADLVRDQRRGQFIEYELNTTVMDDMIRFLMDNFSGKNGRPGSENSPPAEAERSENDLPSKASDER